MQRKAKKEPLLPINHSKLIDGFAELNGFVNYLPFDCICGICSVEVHVTPAMQKYLLEVKRVPVKTLTGGAIFCEACWKRRAQINALRKGDRWRHVEGGASELQQLQTEERAQGGRRRGFYLKGPWPYERS